MIHNQIVICKDKEAVGKAAAEHYIGSDLFCAIGIIGKNIAVLQTRKQLQQRNRLRAIVNISGRQQKSHRPQVFSNDGMNFRVQTSACFADAA